MTLDLCHKNLGKEIPSEWSLANHMQYDYWAQGYNLTMRTGHMINEINKI